jgi:hypothetical protein
MLLNEVEVERFQTRKYRIDYVNKQLISMEGTDWESNDYTCHCPHCDSLNVDELLVEYELSGGY